MRSMNKAGVMEQHIAGFHRHRNQAVKIKSDVPHLLHRIIQFMAAGSSEQATVFQRGIVKVYVDIKISMS
ncbi:MAG: hypothetical protein K0R75_3907, partial [Paenibacillaceae bacterium]|nr:hypothetical protein [Paenibacillaceae bacterium]